MSPLNLPTISFRLKIILLTILVIVGGLLVIFTSFFNYGNLEVTGPAPFSLITENGKAVNCTISPCLIRLAPSDYSGLFQKTDFTDEAHQFSINFNQTTKLDLHFEPIPAVNLSGVWNPNNLQFNGTNAEENLSLESNLNSFPLTSTPAQWSALTQILNSQPSTKSFQFSPDSTQIILDNSQNLLLFQLAQPDQFAVLPIQSSKFFAFNPDSQSIYHLSLDPQTFRPSIFQEDLTQLTFSTPKTTSGPRVRSSTPAQLPIPNPITPALITLVQDFPQAKLFPSLDQQKLALIDLRQNSLYLFDLQSKTRQKLTEQPHLQNLLWLDNQSLMLEGRPENQANAQLSLVELSNSNSTITATLQEISLNVKSNALKLIQALPDQRLLLAESLNTSSNQATSTGFQFFVYNLSTKQKTLIYTVNNLALPLAISYQDGQIYFVSSGNIYRLNIQL